MKSNGRTGAPMMCHWPLYMCRHAWFLVLLWTWGAESENQLVDSNRARYDIEEKHELEVERGRRDFEGRLA